MESKLTPELKQKFEIILDEYDNSDMAIIDMLFLAYQLDREELENALIIAKNSRNWNREQLTTLYSKEEVQKTVENVREAVINEANIIHTLDIENEECYSTINKDNMRLLDLNQFIKK